MTETTSPLPSDYQNPTIDDDARDCVWPLPGPKPPSVWAAK
jgi:hypothetical protein